MMFAEDGTQRERSWMVRVSQNLDIPFQRGVSGAPAEKRKQYYLRSIPRVKQGLPASDPTSAFTIVTICDSDRNNTI